MDLTKVLMTCISVHLKKFGILFSFKNSKQMYSPPKPEKSRRFFLFGISGDPNQEVKIKYKGESCIIFNKIKVPSEFF